jgi:hypothetical protein
MSEDEATLHPVARRISRRAGRGLDVLPQALGEHVHEFRSGTSGRRDAYKAVVTPYEVERYLPIL